MSAGALSRIRCEARHRLDHLVVIAFGAVALGLIALPAICAVRPLLVWNASASAPIGLYRVMGGPARKGDLVLVRTPIAVARLAAKRGYIPLHVPLVKRIAALGGDEVCGSTTVLTVNGQVRASRLERDRAGRRLPWWRECRELIEDEVFLLMVGLPGSFDSRYFGPVSRADLIGRLIPLWTE